MTLVGPLYINSVLLSCWKVERTSLINTVNKQIKHILLGGGKYWESGRSDKTAFQSSQTTQPDQSFSYSLLLHQAPTSAQSELNILGGVVVDLSGWMLYKCQKEKLQNPKLRVGQQRSAPKYGCKHIWYYPCCF